MFDTVSQDRTPYWKGKGPSRKATVVVVLLNGHDGS